MKRIAVLVATGLGIAAVLWAQTSIRTAGDVEATAFIGDGSQLTNVDADLLAGNQSNDFAGASETANELAALRARAVAVAASRTSCRDGMSRAAAWCIDDEWSTAASGGDSTRACHRQAKSLCSLEAIKTCDYIDLRQDPSFPDSCGNRTDGSDGDVIRTLTYDHKNGLDPLDTVGYKDDNTLEFQTSTDVRRYYCCTPAPLVRFEDMGDGTVRDNNTGLFWLKNANCDGTKTWQAGLDWAALLANGQCGLSDGSSAGDWRVPTIRELCSRGKVFGICPTFGAADSLVDTSFSAPALSNIAGDGPCDGAVTDCAFSGVVSSRYWSSSPHFITTQAWSVSMNDGGVSTRFKAESMNAWPVRGGQ